jgi:hypothetical protein
MLEVAVWGLSTGHVVATERLGWPRRRRSSPFGLGELQRQLVYDDEPDRPTATCHLQATDDTAVLCGFPWEMLIEIPGPVGWEDLHPDLRCDRCSERGGFPPADPAATYRFDLS